MWIDYYLSIYVTNQSQLVIWHFITLRKQLSRVSENFADIKEDIPCLVNNYIYSHTRIANSAELGTYGYFKLLSNENPIL